MPITGHRWAVLTAAIGLAVPSLASADVTIGNVLPPSGSQAVQCFLGAPGLLEWTATTGVTPAYTVPSGLSYSMTKWSINTDGVQPGDQATMVVGKPPLLVPGSFRVEATDTETLTAGSLPSGNVETFTLASPVPVDSGDFIGLYFPGTASPGYACGWTAPSGLTSGYVLSSAPTTGQTDSFTGVHSGGGIAGVLNLSATLSPPSYDAGLSLSTVPSNPVVGQPVEVTATVTNNGPAAGPVSFTDSVPAGLPVVAVATDSGTCTTSSMNLVACDLSGIAAGHSGKVVMVVNPASVGSFSNSATVSDLDPAIDPNPANNSASVTLGVGAVPAPPKCVVPKLRRTSVALAKQILPLLDCTVGKTTKSHSRAVAKGLLIATSPGAGSYAANAVIALKVSSGPPPKKHKKRK